MPHDPTGLGRLVADALAGDAECAARRWAASGAMALTGPADDRADVGPARVALAMDALAADVAATSAALGRRVDVDGPALLAERAAIAGLRRQGATSCGGATRLLHAGDGATVALSLARDDDRELVPALRALLGDRADDIGPVAARAEGTPPAALAEAWTAVATCVAGVSGAAFVTAAGELGLPAARCGEASAAVPLVEWTPCGTGSPGDRSAPWTVVDLSSLWAGPLCAQLLGRAGARVVKVESLRRPDGARSGPPPFFDLLHAGHESVAIDLASDRGRRALRALLGAADVVIEASRPRALATMTMAHDDLVAAGWRGVWLSITGHGRGGPAADRVAFGDDAAVAGGLVGGPIGGPVGTAGWFVADAVADPTTGLLAAAAVLRARAARQDGLIAVALATTAAHLARGVADHPPPARPDELEVRPPRARPVTGRAPALGAHNERWLR